VIIVGLATTGVSINSVAKVLPLNKAEAEISNNRLSMVAISKYLYVLNKEQKLDSLTSTPTEGKTFGTAVSHEDFFITTPNIRGV